ncbi:hypothetical protein Tco_1073759 [Tanacetum coccineum]
MALDGNDQDAEYAISKLLQIGTMEDYQREFEMLIKRVTIPKSLLKSFYISALKLDLQCLLLRSNPKTLNEAFSLARAEETRFPNLDIREFLRSNPSSLVEDFFKARITEACLKIIANEDKEHIVEKKINVILSLQGKFASPKAKGSLNTDEYIGVEEVMGGGEVLRIGEDDNLGNAAIDGGDDAVKAVTSQFLFYLLVMGVRVLSNFEEKSAKGMFMCSAIMTTRIILFEPTSSKNCVYLPTLRRCLRFILVEMKLFCVRTCVPM